jgi:hypothetical protein
MIYTHVLNKDGKGEAVLWTEWILPQCRARERGTVKKELRETHNGLCGNFSAISPNTAVSEKPCGLGFKLRNRTT